MAAIRRATTSLVKLAEADAFLPSMGLERREALWAIKALRDEPLELWAAAAEREARVIAEMQEPEVTLKSMTQGMEVVEDYSHTGLTLRQHPVSFLRDDLRKRSIVTCAEAMVERDGRWLMTAGLVLVRQRPGSAKGVMFMTLEDETGIINAVIWPSLFEKQRRVVLSATMLAINARSSARATSSIWSLSGCSTCRPISEVSASVTERFRCNMVAVTGSSTEAVHRIRGINQSSWHRREIFTNPIGTSTR
ncbi:hypothetical protein AJ87_35340 [Rhizobium yanglingense]|nr:hypothetical protein AJ87_35340 [Rhizobium yanglingense]